MRILPVDANDLIEAGICDETNVEKMLVMLTESTHVRPKQNTREELLKVAKKYKRNKIASLGQRSIMAKIREVTPEVTLFLRSIGLSNYYIVKIFDLVGESAIGLTEDNPYWLLEEFPRMGFAKVEPSRKRSASATKTDIESKRGLPFL